MSCIYKICVVVYIYGETGKEKENNIKCKWCTLLFIYLFIFISTPRSENMNEMKVEFIMVIYVQ